MERDLKISRLNRLSSRSRFYGHLFSSYNVAFVIQKLEIGFDEDRAKWRKLGLGLIMVLLEISGSKSYF